MSDLPGFETIGAAIEHGTVALATVGFEEPRRLARRIAAAALGLTTTEVFAHPERALTPPQQARIAETLERALTREPLSRIVGVREFWGREFLLSADALDPRPETETVVESVLRRLVDRAQPYRFLDLGTGSGCILLALLTEYPSATGLGVDIAPGAVSTARANGTRLGLRQRASFAVGNWAKAVGGRFDAVVANPPYIPAPDIPGLPPEVRDHDPRRALDGGADGLTAYRMIAADLTRLLDPAGFFACEIGSTQADAVSAILVEAGLRAGEVAVDLAGLPRCVVAVPAASEAGLTRKKDWKAPASRLRCPGTGASRRSQTDGAEWSAALNPRPTASPRTAGSACIHAARRVR